MSEARIEIVLPELLLESIVEQVAGRVLAELRCDQERRWLPVREAAAELGLSEGALRKHIVRGGVEAARIGSRIFVDMASIGGS